jgi:hypothetical protein
MSMSKRNIFYGFALPAFLYSVWAVLFIYQSSFIALDGNRYYSLFDDAMISMRYAWNLSHGAGLVWNPGEYVEGYSNLFMVLFMSIMTAAFDKPSAVLAVQLSGIFVVVAIGCLTYLISDLTLKDKPRNHEVARLSMLSTICYFPLSYWTLLGMETGLLTLFFLIVVLMMLKWLNNSNPMHLIIAGFAAGLGFLTRNDSIILVTIAFVYLSYEIHSTWDRKRQIHILIAVGVYVLFIVAQLSFRLLYYGEVLPNTYVLKMYHFPLSVRLVGGFNFVVPFFLQLLLPLALTIFALILRPSRVKFLFFVFFVSLVCYQIWVGGDPWPVWRMITPAMPLLLFLSNAGIYDLLDSVLMRKMFGLIKSRTAFLAGVLIIFATNYPFREGWLVDKPSAISLLNAHNVNVAIAINSLTRPDASIGVFWGGVIPYYSDRYAVDFLGKSDKYIARLDPDLSGKVGWDGMKSVPGHNKYDLYYSIKLLKPTYVQSFYWGKQNISKWGRENYVRVVYRGPNGEITLKLLKNSPSVIWENGEILP